MSLSLQAIDRLFTRLGATYGRNFLGQYEGQEAVAIKASWAHEMSGYAANMGPIAWALENLPERAPNVIEFRNLCRRSPAADMPRLPEPAADKARVEAELAKLGHMRGVKPVAVNGMKDWAHRLKHRHDAGDKLNMNQVKCYREALGLNAPTLEAA